MTAPTTSDFVGLADTIYNQTNWTPEQRVQIRPKSVRPDFKEGIAANPQG